MDLITHYMALVHNTQTSKIWCSFNDFYSQRGIGDGEFELEFLQDDLYRAALTVGKGSFDEVFRIPYYSKYEIEFRIDMVRAFLNLEGEHVKRSEAFYLLDPSEKGAINYFIGMIFSQLIATSRLNVIWLVHLDSYDKNQLEYTGENRKRPDFIGIRNDEERIVLESKGWMTKKNDGIRNALRQLRAVLSVEGEQNILKVASILYERSSQLYLDIIDPKEKGLIKIFAGKSDYLKDYYSRVFNLLQGSKETVVIDDCIFVIRKVNCKFLEIGLLKDVYDIINETVKNENNKG